MAELEPKSLCVWISNFSAPTEQEVNKFLDIEVSKIYFSEYEHARECCVVLKDSDEVCKALGSDNQEWKNDVVSVSKLNSLQYHSLSEMKAKKEVSSEIDINNLASTISSLTRDKLTELLALVGAQTETDTKHTDSSRSDLDSKPGEYDAITYKTEMSTYGDNCGMDDDYETSKCERQTYITEQKHQPPNLQHKSVKTHTQQQFESVHGQGRYTQQHNTYTDPHIRQHREAGYQAVPYGNMCRISLFSGDDNKGEVAYKQWRHEVRSLILEGCPAYVVLPAIRRAVKGTAADVLMNLGEGVSPQEILNKFDASFGNILTSETLLEDFFSANQQPGEGIAAWSCRLESTLAKAQHKGAMMGNADQMLRSKFYKGLQDSRVKEGIRHHFDSNIPFTNLLQYARQIEHEYGPKTKPPTRSYVQEVDNSMASRMDKMMELMKSLNKRIDEMEKRNTGNLNIREPTGNPHLRRYPSCFYCGQEGHIQRRCPHKPGNGRQPTPRGGC